MSTHRATYNSQPCCVYILSPILLAQPCVSIHWTPYYWHSPVSIYLAQYQPRVRLYCHCDDTIESSSANKIPNQQCLSDVTHKIFLRDVLPLSHISAHIRTGPDRQTTLWLTLSCSTTHDLQQWNGVYTDAFPEPIVLYRDYVIPNSTCTLLSLSAVGEQ